ncbi:MAG: transcription antitermination factor NusB [Atopobiaceae bacterium]|nr:transcription antitermination factor NusB [Atopobiaceae bacterium]
MGRGEERARRTYGRRGSRASAARVAAAGLVREVRARDGRVKDVARGSAALAGLSERDRDLAMRLACGVVATSGRLDEVMGSHLTGRGHLEPRVRDALRVSCFELLYLSTPASVAVDQGVELVRARSPRAAGLANAVLRRVAEEDRPRVEAARRRLEGHVTGDAAAAGPAAAGDAADADDLADLALVSGLPDWLVHELVGAVGLPAARRACLDELEPAPVYVRANPMNLSPDEAPARLAELGLGPRRVEDTDVYLLERPGALASSGLVQEAAVVPADLAAQLVALVAAPRPGATVLEVGQGRGTKSLLLEAAALAGGGVADILGVDSEAFKCRVSRRRMRAARLSDHVSSLVLDARELGGKEAPAGVVTGYDLVFVDAPCSGSGTMRRHPEIAWSLARASVEPGDPEGAAAPGCSAVSGDLEHAAVPGDPERAAAPSGVGGLAPLPALQLQILTAAATRVRPGGELVYATCSFLPQENADVVDAFLGTDEGADFELAPVCEAWGVRRLGEGGQRLLRSFSDGGTFLSLPGKWACDLHFCARMVRRGQ